MRLILFAAILALLTPGLLAAKTSKKSVAIEKEIRRLDSAHAAAVLRGDLVAMDKIWTKDFVVNNPFNGVDRADRIRTGAVTYSSFDRVPESIVIHGNTVIVMGHETVVPKGSSPDAGKTINRRYTNIWMMRKGKWRLVARHANVICQD